MESSGRVLRNVFSESNVVDDLCLYSDMDICNSTTLLILAGPCITSLAIRNKDTVLPCVEPSPKSIVCDLRPTTTMNPSPSLAFWPSLVLMIRIPLIISEVVGMCVSTLPPNPPPQKELQVALTAREGLLRLLMKGGPSFMRGVYLLGGLIEIVALVAHVFSSWPWSPMILDLLSFSNASGKLDLHINPFGMFGAFIATLGALLRWRCYQTLGRHFTLELSVLKDHELITSGPYSIVRHPSYTGGLMTVFGAILSRGSHGSWLRESGVLHTRVGAALVGSWVFLACGLGFGASSRVKQEDAFLRKEFGIEWDRWAARVPYRLFPGIY